MSRELDAEVAEKVFGHVIVADGLGYVGIKNDYSSDYCPHYSTDISAAWEVVEKFPDHEIGVYRHKKSNGKTEWGCLFKLEGDEFAAWADTAQMAICKVALEAVKDKK